LPSKIQLNMTLIFFLVKLNDMKCLCLLKYEFEDIKDEIMS